MDIHDSLNSFDYTVVIGYIVALLTLGFWVSMHKKHTREMFIAERSLKWYQIGFSMFGTNVSPVIMIGFCGIGYGVGMVAANFDWLAWWFLLLLAMVFAPRYLGAKVSTMPQFMKLRFGNGCHTFLSWYALVSTLLLWLSGALYAGSLLLGQIMGWELWQSVVLLTILSASFAVAGGLQAVAIVNTFQSILMIIVSAILGVIAMTRIGGFGNMIEAVPTGHWKLFHAEGVSDYPWYAILLGYPSQAVWFWCTDQTIVQLVLGAKNLRHGQYGTVFISYLKIIAPFLFIFPGILCLVLFPNLNDQDEAYMAMVSELLPNGMKGLVIAVIFGALISTVNSGLNAFGTILTLDIYGNNFRPNAGDKEIIWVGRAAMVLAAIVAVLCAIGLGQLGKSLFDVITGIIAFLAPPMTAVFLVSVVWNRATAKAAMTTFILGTIISLAMGWGCLTNTPEGFWPHYLLLSFYLASGLIVLMVMVSLLTKAPALQDMMPTISEIYAKMGYSAKPVWIWYGVLFVIMIAVYAFFEYAGTR